MAKVAVSASAVLFLIAVLGPASAQDAVDESVVTIQGVSESVDDLIKQASIQDSAVSQEAEPAPVQLIETTTPESDDVGPDESLRLAGFVEKQEEVPIPPSNSELVTADEIGPVFLHEDGSRISGDLWGTWNTWFQTGLYAGVEGTFLAPINEPIQSVYLTDLTNNNQYTARSQSGLGGGVRTWIGLQNHGWGFRVRYWHFGDEAVRPDPVVPTNAEPTTTSASYLRADVVDIELTQRYFFLGQQISTSFGARYAELERNNTAVAYGDLGNGVNLYGLAMGANNVSGTGFTTSIGGLKPLHFFWNRSCDDCGGACGGQCARPCGQWLGYWNVRGSVLWADSTVSALTDANAVIKGAAVASAFSRNKASASKDHSETLGIIELQLGMQYQRHLRCCPAIAFLRAGAEYQYWNTGDLTATSNSFAFLQGGTPAFGARVDSVADAHNGNLGLIGFTIGAGLTY